MMKIVATIAVSACAGGFSDACARSPHMITLDEVGPGVYGIVNIGDGPQPPLLKPQPVTAVRTYRRKALEPVYLHVPPVHATKWAHYCFKYHACHRPVFFVKSSEYGPDYRRPTGGTYAEAR